MVQQQQQNPGRSQHNHMSETGIYIICQYGIKIDLNDRKVGLWEANMKRADEPA